METIPQPQLVRYLTEGFASEDHVPNWEGKSKPNQLKYDIDHISFDPPSPLPPSSSPLYRVVFFSLVPPLKS